MVAYAGVSAYLASPGVRRFLRGCQPDLK
jgi:hypothetical protein